MEPGPSPFPGPATPAEPASKSGPPPTGSTPPRGIVAAVAVIAVVVAVAAGAVWLVPALTGGSSAPESSNAPTTSNAARVSSPEVSPIASAPASLSPTRLPSRPAPTLLPGGPFASTGSMVVDRHRRVPLARRGLRSASRARTPLRRLVPLPDMVAGRDAHRGHPIRSRRERDPRRRRPASGNRAAHRTARGAEQPDDRALLPVLDARRDQRVLPRRRPGWSVAARRPGGRQRADRRIRTRVDDPLRQPVLLRLDRQGPAARPHRHRDRVPSSARSAWTAPPRPPSIHPATFGPPR